MSTKELCDFIFAPALVFIELVRNIVDPAAGFLAGASVTGIAAEGLLAGAFGMAAETIRVVATDFTLFRGTTIAAPGRFIAVGMEKAPATNNPVASTWNATKINRYAQTNSMDRDIADMEN
jgi:hypothetical protein